MHTKGCALATGVFEYFALAARVIYKIISPSKRVYIGQTTNFMKRHADYKRLASASEEAAKKIPSWRQPKLRNSLRKHGYDAHKVEIVLQCGKHELDMCEIKFIALYDSNHNGLNCTDGGTIGEGGVWKASAEQKEKVHSMCGTVRVKNHHG